MKEKLIVFSNHGAPSQWISLRSQVFATEVKWPNFLLIHFSRSLFCSMNNQKWKVIVLGGDSLFSVVNYMWFFSTLEIAHFLNTGTMMNLEHFLQALVHWPLKNSLEKLCHTPSQAENGSCNSPKVTQCHQIIFLWTNPCAYLICNFQKKVAIFYISLFSLLRNLLQFYL